MAIIYTDHFSKLVSEKVVLSVPVAASLEIQGSVGKVTFVADAVGVSGNLITVAFTGGATAGAEAVTVVGNAISVQIETGVTTAAQVKSAVDAYPAAAALVNTTATTGGAVEVATAAALTGGSDGVPSTVTNLVRTGVGAFSYTVAKEFRDVTVASLAVHSNHASSLSNVAKAEILNFDEISYEDVIIFKLVDYAGSAVDVSVVSTLLLSFIFSA